MTEPGRDTITDEETVTVSASATDSDYRVALRDAHQDLVEYVGSRASLTEADLSNAVERNPDGTFTATITARITPQS